MTAQVIQRDKLGVLTKIGQGGQGVVYGAPNVTTKFAASMVYKEYKTQTLTEIDFTALAAMPALVEESLSYAQAERLISIAAWPCALVEDGGRPTGFVMPAIPDEFFIPLKTVKGVSTTTAEFQHLLNHPSVLAARDIEIDDAQRYTLLREVASGLSFMHKHGVCIGDISPKNLLFSLAPHEAVYFIDCDAVRIDGVSALPQVQTPGWDTPAGEELATIYSDTYKLGLLALRLLAGDQDTKNPQHIPSTTPALVRQIITDTLTNETAKRPLPEAWTYVLGHAIEQVQHQKLTPAPVPATPTRPPVPIVRTRPAVHSRPPVGPAPPTQNASQAATAQRSTKGVAANPASQHGQVFSEMTSVWAKVIAAGDDHFGRIGRVTGVCDDLDDDDGFDVIVEFPGEPDRYAFRRDELTAVAPADGEDFWFNVGIDLIRIITSAGDFLTLRCYLDDEPIFLGNNGLIHAFRTRRTLRRYLAGNSDNDMSSLSTYGDITVAATEGSLPLDEVTEDNIYALDGLAEDIAAGPDQIDPVQLDLAVELLSDVGDYVKTAVVKDCLRKGQPLGDLVKSVLAKNGILRPGRPDADALTQWTQLEDFLESRLRVK